MFKRKNRGKSRSLLFNADGTINRVSKRPNLSNSLVDRSFDATRDLDRSLGRSTRSNLSLHTPSHSSRSIPGSNSSQCVLKVFGSPAKKSFLNQIFIKSKRQDIRNSLLFVSSVIDDSEVSLRKSILKPSETLNTSVNLTRFSETTINSDSSSEFLNRKGRKNDNSSIDSADGAHFSDCFNAESTNKTSTKSANVTKRSNSDESASLESGRKKKKVGKTTSGQFEDESNASECSKYSELSDSSISKLSQVRQKRAVIDENETNDNVFSQCFEDKSNSEATKTSDTSDIIESNSLSVLSQTLKNSSVLKNDLDDSTNSPNFNDCFEDESTLINGSNCSNKIVDDKSTLIDSSNSSRKSKSSKLEVSSISKLSQIRRKRAVSDDDETNDNVFSQCFEDKSHSDAIQTSTSANSDKIESSNLSQLSQTLKNSSTLKNESDDRTNCTNFYDCFADESTLKNASNSANLSGNTKTSDFVESISLDLGGMRKRSFNTDKTSSIASLKKIVDNGLTLEQFDEDIEVLSCHLNYDLSEPRSSSRYSLRPNTSPVSEKGLEDSTDDPNSTGESTLIDSSNSTRKSKRSKLDDSSLSKLSRLRRKRVVIDENETNVNDFSQCFSEKSTSKTSDSSDIIESSSIRLSVSLKHSTALKNGHDDSMNGLNFSECFGNESTLNNRSKSSNMSRKSKSPDTVDPFSGFAHEAANGEFNQSISERLDELRCSKNAILNERPVTSSKVSELVQKTKTSITDKEVTVNTTTNEKSSTTGNSTRFSATSINSDSSGLDFIDSKLKRKGRKKDNTSTKSADGSHFDDCFNVESTSTKSANMTKSSNVAESIVAPKVSKLNRKTSESINGEEEIVNTTTNEKSSTTANSTINSDSGDFSGSKLKKKGRKKDNCSIESADGSHFDDCFNVESTSTKSANMTKSSNVAESKTSHSGEEVAVNTSVNSTRFSEPSINSDSCSKFLNRKGRKNDNSSIDSADGAHFSDCFNAESTNKTSTKSANVTKRSNSDESASLGSGRQKKKVGKTTSGQFEDESNASECSKYSELSDSSISKLSQVRQKRAVIDENETNDNVFSQCFEDKSHSDATKTSDNPAIVGSTSTSRLNLKSKNSAALINKLDDNTNVSRRTKSSDFVRVGRKTKKTSGGDEKGIDKAASMGFLSEIFDDQSRLRQLEEEIRASRMSQNSDSRERSVTSSKVSQLLQKTKTSIKDKEETVNTITNEKSSTTANSTMFTETSINSDSSCSSVSKLNQKGRKKNNDSDKKSSESSGGSYLKGCFSEKSSSTTISTSDFGCSKHRNNAQSDANSGSETSPNCSGNSEKLNVSSSDLDDDEIDEFNNTINKCGWSGLFAKPKQSNVKIARVTDRLGVVKRVRGGKTVDKYVILNADGTVRKQVKRRYRWLSERCKNFIKKKMSEKYGDDFEVQMNEFIEYLNCIIETVAKNRTNMNQLFMNSVFLMCAKYGIIRTPKMFYNFAMGCFPRDFVDKVVPRTRLQSNSVTIDYDIRNLNRDVFC